MSFPMLVIALAASLCQASEEPKSQPPQGKPFRVGGATVQPKTVKVVRPKFPEEALRGGLFGGVILEAVVDTKGSVKEVRVLKGDPPLSDAAIEAVKKWLYKPLLLNGEATGFILTVTVRFDTLGHERRLQFRDLIESLRSKHEAVRESAARWLGGGRRQMSPGSVVEAIRELESLLEHEESERVRAAATQALQLLERK